MRTIVFRLAATLVLAFGFGAAPVQAASTVSIDIVVNAITGVQTVTATAPFCPSGTAVNSDFKFAGGGRAGTFHLTKILTCDDGSGSLTIRVDAATANGSPHDQGGWSVISGTGAYAGASGGGNLIGDYTPTGIIDHYTGVLQI